VTKFGVHVAIKKVRRPDKRKTWRYLRAGLLQAAAARDKLPSMIASSVEADGDYIPQRVVERRHKWTQGRLKGAVRAGHVRHKDIPAARSRNSRKALALPEEFVYGYNEEDIRYEDSIAPPTRSRSPRGRFLPYVRRQRATIDVAPSVRRTPIPQAQTPPVEIESHSAEQLAHFRKQRVVVAIGILKEHPDWSDRAVAKAAKINPGNLTRSPLYQQAKATLKSPGVVRRGYRESSGSVVAIDEPE
jgi:hypothetical protein